MKRSLVFIGFTLVALLLAGCGGGDQKSFTAGARSGGATFTFKWPDTTRLIPQATQSIAIRVMKEGQVTPVAERYANRPAVGGISTVTFDRLPVGTFTAIATAYPQWNAGGTALATGSVPLVTQSGKVTVVTLTMASRVDHLTLLPASPGVAIGHTRQLSISAIDADGNYLLLSPSKLTWESLDTAKATVDGNGLVTGMALGTATVRVTDTESTKTTSVTVTITEAVAGTDVTFVTSSECQWVAFQDGDGPWQVLGTTPGAYTQTVTDPEGRYGIAMVEGSGVGVLLGTTNEITTIDQTDSFDAMYSLSGNLANNVGSTLVTLGTSATYPYGPGSFSLPGITAGTYDLCALNKDVSPVRMYLERNLTVSGDITSHDIDFAGSNAFDLATNYTVGGSFDWGDIGLLTVHQTRIAISEGSSGFAYASLPADRMIPGDLYHLGVYGPAFDITRFFATPQNITIATPTPFTSPAMSLVTSGGYPRPSFSWSAYPGAIAYDYFFMSTGSGLVDHWLSVTADWATAAGNTVTFPDFSGLPGWNTAWNVITVDDWNAEAMTANATLNEVIAAESYTTPQAADGMEITYVTGSSAPPPPLAAQRGKTPAQFTRKHSPFF